MRITSLRLNNCSVIRRAGLNARVGSLPVDYDGPLFDDAVVPYHNRPRVSKYDDLRMHDGACDGQIQISISNKSKCSPLPVSPWPIVTSPRISTSAQVIDFE